MAAPSCPNCLTGYMKTEKPSGTISTIHGLNTYIATPPNAPKALIVLITDIFGWELSNCRLLADSLSQDGDYLVYVPDFLNGNSPPPGTMETMNALLAPSPSWATTLLYKPFWAVKFASAAIPFMARNRDVVIRPRIYDFHRAVRADPTTAHLALGSAGYCWGGKYTIYLCQEGLVDAGFAGHPSKMVFPDDWGKIAKPLSVAVGDVDMVNAIADVRKIEELLGAKTDVETELRVYEGAKHGFAIRADPRDEGQTKSAVGSQKQSLEWFGRWLTGKGEQK
ncbi:hypothetical protein VE03_00927 [Pseudogymnoascus sp. 23342-1-I1]|nr:hypothetical protein VE03_00927 [Pseudogymnoascus sp. 23342-1-I1]